ncbi:MAG: class I SAM-dependent methyltransferase [Bacteroidota bacterium]
MDKGKIPWPTKAAMQQVYQEKLWGDNGTRFYSGEGSHHPKLVHPYLEVVTTFLKSFEKPLAVCDLGCGDFNIGRELVPYTTKYIAVDIVQELIRFNSRKFMYPQLEFQYLDIAQDILPKGDCVILRQVLQHLSNAEVKRVVEQLYNFRYVILTEHLPENDFIPNKDIISGQGIRLKNQSGVDVLKAPHGRFRLRM